MSTDHTAAPVRPRPPGAVILMSICSALFPLDAARAVLQRSRAVATAAGIVVATEPVRDAAGLKAVLGAHDPASVAGLAIQMGTFATAELLHALVDWMGPARPALTLWALEEPGEIVTNSLCGAQLWSSTLHRLGRKAGFVVGNPEAPLLARDLAAFAAGARAAHALRGARVALVGSHAAWFTNLATDPWVLGRALGVTVAQVSLPAFLDGCTTTPEAASEAARRWDNVSFETGDAAAHRLTLGQTLARLEAGLDRLEADAVAIRDWPEILYGEAFRGTWAALGELSDRAVTVTPEGDVPGALTALAARAMDPGALPFLTDISGIDRGGNRLVLWHYGVSPRLAAGPRRVDAILKQESFDLQAGPLTLLRLSVRPDGRLRLFAAEGDLLPDRTGANRAAGYFRPRGASAEALVRRFIAAGYEHHVTALYGAHAASALAMAEALDIEVDHV